MKFFGRDEEIEALRREVRISETHSRLVVITGRRGVGKTTLSLKVAFESARPMLYFLCRRGYAQEALAGVWMDDVRETFGLADDAGPRRLTLANVIKFVMSLSREKPCVMILDECQELDDVAPAFWADLQGVWDVGKDTSRLLLMMIGVVAPAMRHIFDDAGEPLFGRQDMSLRLRPFSPLLLRELFLACNPKGRPDDLLTLYAVTGGVASHVNFLAESAPLTREDMVNLIFSEKGDGFRAEGERILADTLPPESDAYERILRALAGDSAKGGDIVEQLQGQAMAGAMDRLESHYGMVRKMAPMFSDSPRGIRYAISDPYFRFWFRFIEPAQYQSQAARGNWAALRSVCFNALEQYTGRTLEDWYHDLIGSSPNWTRIGRWWDRKGLNEIDLIALNELSHHITIYEIKRNPKKVDLAVMAVKAKAFREASQKELKKYPEPRLLGLSLEMLLDDPAGL